MLESYWILLYGYIAYYLIVTIGITYGYHRYFSHQEFATNSVGEVVMLYCGLLCGCRSPLGWVGVHRMHHRYADTPKDPHSAKFQPWWKILFSLWSVDSIPRKYIKDCLKNKRIIFFHKYRYHIYSITALLVYIIFSIPGIIILSQIFILSYLGFGLLNLFGHDAEGPANRLWVNLIAPFEGNHKDHHEESNNAVAPRANR